MCGTCYCQGCHNCGCKYNCDGVVCDSTFPTCCCSKPPSQCGCCMTWDDQQASCINGTYYITFPVNNASDYYIVNGEQVLYTQGYIVFQMINCIACTSVSGVSINQGIFNFMVWWNQCMLIQAGFNSGNDFTAVCSNLTTTNPGSTFLNVTATYNGQPNCCSNSNLAENCYYWPAEVDGNVTEWTADNACTPSGLAFTSYCSVGSCNFSYPLYTAGTCMY